MSRPARALVPARVAVVHERSKTCCKQPRSTQRRRPGSFIYGAEPRDLASVTASDFRQWCQNVLKPAVQY